MGNAVCLYASQYYQKGNFSRLLLASRSAFLNLFIRRTVMNASTPKTNSNSTQYTRGMDCLGLALYHLMTGQRVTIEMIMKTVSQISAFFMVATIDYGGGMLRSTQILRASLLAISVCRGTDDVFLLAGLK